MSKFTAKKLSFYLILFAMPFILLLLVELTLRGVGFGEEIPLFIPVEQEKDTRSPLYLQPNPKVINRYFANEKLAPQVSPDTVYFNKHKSADSFRIFIQGGSTAAGFPYGRWASLQGMLEQRFKRIYPDKNIEIINTAMAAVNSYTLLDFVDEIIEQQPDLVLIYAGHNEYLGVMGVGSAFAAKGGRLTTLLHLKFKNWRIYQLLQTVYFALLSSDEQAVKTDKTLMSQVVKEKEIRLNSDLYQRGIEQFTENMSLIISKYRQAGIPIVLGNLVSNESGQVPFTSVGKVDWPLYKKLLAQQSKEQIAANIVKLQQAIARNKMAVSYYQLGLNLELIGKYQEAKQAFITAKDLDLLRFRAPSEFNTIVKTLAVKHKLYFADVNSRFIASSANGIIGNSLILEHLHPTVSGYFELAEAYVDVINNEQLIKTTAQNYPSEQARLDVPVSKVDKLYGDFVIAKLMNDYPFVATSQQHDNIELPASESFEKQALIKRIKNDSWLGIQKNLLVKYQQAQDIPEAAKVAGAISTAMVDNHKASYIAGQLYQQRNDWQLARFYHQKAYSNQTLTEKEKVKYALVLAQDYFMLKQYTHSMDILNTANEIVPITSPLKAKISQYLRNTKRAMTLNEPTD